MRAFIAKHAGWLCIWAGFAVLTALTPHMPGWLAVAVSPLLVAIPGAALLALFEKGRGILPAAGLRLIAATALGLAIMIAEALLLNTLLPLVSNVQPLSQTTIVLAHALLPGGLFFLARHYLMAARLRSGLAALLPQHFLRHAPLASLPLLAAFGAILLNNGGSNILAVTALAGVVATISIQLVRRVFSPVWVLYVSALALLLATSLRSHYISGFDISHEFQVFTATLQQGHWTTVLSDPYNACLSLTLLPVFLQNLLQVSPEIIYKVSYQAIFALLPVLVYYLARLAVRKKWAFLAGVFYLAQTQFIVVMPALVRQQIAFLFFGLLIYLVLRSDLRAARTKLLFLTLAAGMVVSHYSTTYTAIALLLLYIGGQQLFMWWQRRTADGQPLIAGNVSLRMVVIIMLMTLFWNAQITASANNFNDVISKATQNLQSTFTEDARSDVAQKAITGGAEIDYNSRLAEYYQEREITDTDKLVYRDQVVLPEGNALLVWAADMARSALVLLIRALVIGGIGYLLWRTFRRRELSRPALMSLGAFVGLAAVLALPSLSLSYNFERVYQQVLVVLAVAVVWAGFKLLPPFLARFRYATAAIVVILHVVLTPGIALVNQFSGDIPPRLYFNNYGEDYEKFYTHRSDVLVAHWVQGYCDGRIFADRYASLKLIAYGQQAEANIGGEILQPMSHKCTVLSYTNTQANVGYVTYNSQALSFVLSQNFYDQNYNQVYSTGEAEVQKKIR